SASSGPWRTYTFRDSKQDDHQEDDAPPKGKKRAKKRKTSKISKSAMALHQNNQLKNLNLMYLNDNSNNKNVIYGLRNQ
ncbi:hypothetical protein Tco_0577243, partial [Tanacetum coccineum]